MQPARRLRGWQDQAEFALMFSKSPAPYQQALHIPELNRVQKKYQHPLANYLNYDQRNYCLSRRQQPKSMDKSFLILCVKLIPVGTSLSASEKYRYSHNIDPAVCSEGTIRPLPIFLLLQIYPAYTHPLAV